MLPFVLRPGAEICKIEDPSSGKSAAPQIFTFRSKEDYSKDNPPGILNFCPTAVKKNINDDISMQLIYDHSVTGKEANKKRLTYNSLVKNLPGLQIREFLPDTALDQCINFFTDMVSNISQLFGKDGITKKTDDKTIDVSSDKFDIGKFAKKIANVCWYAVKYLSGYENPSIVDEVLKGKAMDSYVGGKYSKPPLENKILKFPYMLYYKLQSCTTTAIYEVPCLNTNSNHMYSSDGTPGWGDDAGFSLLPKSISGLPLIGSLLGKLFGNMNISFMPWWNAQQGNGAKEPSIVVQFDLFNDTDDAAITNFIFVNTIIPSNKWIQYGLFQHSPHLYDIKLEGYNRLFACTGKFEVNYAGVLRDPPLSWYEADGKLSGHINGNIKKSAFLESLKNDKSIKIPDIYKVTLTFDSLLPANFNNYLYTLVSNQSSLTTYKSKAYDPSQLADALTNGVKELVTGVKKAWNDDSQKYVPEDQRRK